MVEKTATGNTGRFGPHGIIFFFFILGFAMGRKPKGFPRHFLMAPRFLKTLA